MAVGKEFATTTTDTVFDGTSNGDVAGTPVTGNTINNTGYTSLKISVHANNQAGTPADDVRVDVYEGVDVSGSPEWEITPSLSRVLNLVAANGGIDPNSKVITLFDPSEYSRVVISRIGSTDTIRCRVRYQLSRIDPTAS